MADPTVHFLPAFEQELAPPGFFTTLFTVPSDGFFDAEEVEYDVRRSGGPVAVAVKDIEASRRVGSNVWTTKRIAPPILSLSDGMKASKARGFGEHAYMTPEVATRVVGESLRMYRQFESMMRRTIELEAAQVLTTGKVDLVDAAGVSQYEVDFQPKTTHFAKTGTTWTAAGTNVLSDLLTWCNVLKADGYRARQAIFGATALDRFLGNAGVQKALDLRWSTRAQVEAATLRTDGAHYHGTISVGTYMLEILSYDGSYDDPQTGADTSYMPETKVILRDNDASRVDMRLLFGSCPLVVPVDARMQPFLPERASSRDGRFDLWPNAYTATNRVLTIEGASRPVIVPASIDSFGCFDTTQ